MKLIKRTYKLALLWLIPVLVAGSIFCFYMISYIIYEETDEFLTYEMNRLVAYHNLYHDLPEFQNVANIMENIEYPVPVFKDTMLLETGDNEMVPYRELFFTIDHKGKKFTLVLRHLLVGKDDIFEGTLWIISGLMLLVVVTIILMVSQVSNKIWQPFYKTLKMLGVYKINDPVPTFPTSDIDEFNTLNKTVEGLLKKINNDYKRTKEFNGNASHELQTHLAVIRANSETLINKQENNSIVDPNLQTIYNETLKLSQVQKSLMLLSKIGNLEFNKVVSLNLAEVVKQSLLLFKEAIDIREITVTGQIKECLLSIDAGLAEILVNNLIKNAVKHNIQNGYLLVTLDATVLIIENSGLSYEGNPAILLERFHKGQNGNSGIGLAIVRQICELYHFDISYNIKENNIHIIRISFCK